VSDKTSERLTSSGLLQVFKRLGRATGIHVSPHALRRTCALWCHRAGWTLEAIRRLLGHSDFKVLQRYLDLDTDDIRAAHDAAPPSGRLSGRH
jgi:integrase/recombinase XerD